MPTSIKNIASNNTNTGTLSIGRAEFKNSQAKLIKILTSECPANIFAKSRIPRLTARDAYDTNSMRIINGAIAVGVPVGYSMDRYLTPWIENPIKMKVTIVDILNKKVSDASEVVVSTPGTMPSKLALKIDACIPEVAMSLSSHSLSPASSSSNSIVPLVVRAIVTQSPKLSISFAPVKSNKSSK
jgi:hypothetical protein